MTPARPLSAPSAPPALRVEVQRLPHAADLPLPQYESAGAAGMDVLAALKTSVTLKPGEQMRVPTGLALSLPLGFEAQIRPRSGLAAKYGLTIPNSPGTIDSDYRGELQVLLLNLGRAEVELTRGMRIAQLIVAPVTRIAWQEVAALPATPRGDGGFGSTGTQGL